MEPTEIKSPEEVDPNVFNEDYLMELPKVRLARLVISSALYCRKYFALYAGEEGRQPFEAGFEMGVTAGKTRRVLGDVQEMESLLKWFLVQFETEREDFEAYPEYLRAREVLHQCDTVNEYNAAMEELKEPCAECAGLGGVSRRVGSPNVGSYHIECPRCKGSTVTRP